MIGRHYYSPLMSAIWSTPLSLEQLREMSELTGQLHSGQLPRVDAVALANKAGVKVRLQFDSGDAAVLVNGEFGATLTLVCQRCLEPVSVELGDKVRVALVDADKAADIPEGYESVVVGNEGIRLVELLEDEILLSIPLSARHDAGECGELAARLSELGATSGDSGTNTPFAGLGQMLRKKQN